MSKKNKTKSKQDSASTMVSFDLSAELSAEELAKFQSSAKGKDLTQHFLDVTIRSGESAA